jgi:hypothetical protein
MFSEFENAERQSVSQEKYQFAEISVSKEKYQDALVSRLGIPRNDVLRKINNMNLEEVCIEGKGYCYKRKSDN